MSKEDIINTFKTALNNGVCPFKASTDINPDSHYAKAIPRTQVRTSRENINTIVEAIRNEPELKLYDGGWQWDGLGSGSKIDPSLLANWMLAQVINGAKLEDVVEQVYRCVELNKARAHAIHALAGIKIEKRYDLNDNLYIIPFDHLSDSDQKDSLLGIRTYIHNRSPLRINVTPSAALIREYEVEPIFTEHSVIKRSCKSRHSVQKELDNACLCLTLIGPCAPAVLMEWTEFIDPVPLTEMDGGASIPHVEIGPYDISKFGAFDPAQASDVINSYALLNQEEKKHMRIPLERLNLSLRRIRAEDMAIELGIALESLLANDLGWEVRIGDTIRQRAAYLIGGSKEERIGVKNLVRVVYSLRSCAAHTGTINSAKCKILCKEAKYTMRDKPYEEAEYTIREILWEGSKLCSELIKRVLKIQHIPNWNNLFLSKVE